MTTTMHAAYMVASLTLAPKAPNTWGLSDDTEINAARDHAAAYDGAGAVMPCGGLTEDEEWAVEFASWTNTGPGPGTGTGPGTGGMHHETR